MSAATYLLPDLARASGPSKLTKRAIDQALPRAHDCFIWDSEVRGFGCEITPRGKKVYVVFYRTREGLQRRPTIGAHGTLTCEQARVIAKQMLVAALNGHDPSKERRERRHSMTMQELVERYIDEYAKVHKKLSSVKQDVRMLRRKVEPFFGSTKVQSITRSDIHRRRRSGEQDQS